MPDPRNPSSRPQPARGGAPARPGERDFRGNRPAPAPSASTRPPLRSAAPPVAVAHVKSGIPHGATESGWLPDLVYTGGKFESGLAFFADAVGRITRFSREPADLAMARRLEGQAALPGLVNAHSHAFHRTWRGRTEPRGREALAHERALARLGDEDIFDTARMVFMEMLLAGTTCVGEFHTLQHQPDGSQWPEPGHLAHEVLRAAREVGVRIAFFPAAWMRGDFARDAGTAPARFRTASAEQFVRETETLRVAIEKEFPADEAWLGVAAQSLATVPLEAFKAVATYARAQKLRFHAHVSTTTAENAACLAEYGRTPVTLLAEHGLLDKRFTAVDALQVSDEEAKLLGAARTTVCACPFSEHSLGLGATPLEKLLAAGASIALGTDSHLQVDLLEEARLLEFHARAVRLQRSAIAPEAATALFHAATFTGARSLGATSGALEVGRPADFFTLNLYDPSVAGADADSLLAHVVFGLQRRAIRDVWIGGQQRIANGRHPAHGPIVGRFVDLQRRLWAG